MRYGKHLAVLALATAGLAGTYAHAAEAPAQAVPTCGSQARPHPYREHKAQHMAGRMAQQLGLSQEQRQALQGVLDKYLPQLHDMRQSLRDNRCALMAVSADDPRLQELAAAQGRTIADGIVLRKQMQAEVDNMLTEPQRARLHEMQQRRSRHGHGGWDLG